MVSSAFGVRQCYTRAIAVCAALRLAGCRKIKNLVKIITIDHFVWSFDAGRALCLEKVEEDGVLVLSRRGRQDRREGVTVIKWIGAAG